MLLGYNYKIIGLVCQGNIDRMLLQSDNVTPITTHHSHPTTNIETTSHVLYKKILIQKTQLVNFKFECLFELM